MAGKFMDDEEMQGMSFGHAGTIVEGEEESATEKIARLEAAGIPVVQRIDGIPDLVKAKLAERSVRMRSDGLFIAVEVDDRAAAADAPLARKLDRGLPCRHLRRHCGTARSSWSSRTSTSACLFRLCLDADRLRRRSTGEGHQALRRRRSAHLAMARPRVRERASW